nr:ABC transporter substrate-binding protein [Natrononativus amylolyticus]
MHNRRRFLKATAVAGTAVGLSGCLGEDDDDHDLPAPEDDEEYEELDTIEWVGISRDAAPLRNEAQGMIADQWAELGIDVNVDIRDLSGLFDRWYDRDFDVLTLWVVARPDRLDPFFMLVHNFHSDYADEGENAIQFRSDEYDELADRIRSEMDEDARQEAVMEAQEILAEEQPVIPIYHQDALSAANESSFGGWTEQIGAYPYWSVAVLDNLEPVDGQDQFTLASLEEPTTIHPMAIQGNAAAEATKMIFSRLVRYTTDGEPEPAAASEIEVVDDTTVEVELREDITFHDGESLTADDVQFTMDYYQEYEVPYMAGYYDVVESVDVVDDETVHFNLEEPDASFTTVSLSQLNILPQHIWEDVVDDEGISHPNEYTDDEVYVGSGPFEFVTYDPQDQIVYETYDDYPLAEIDFETLVWSLYGSESTAFGAVEQGEADCIQEIQVTHFEEAEANEDLKATASESHGVTSVWLQNERDPFTDQAFRQALAHVTDKQRVVQVILEGRGQEATSQIAPANDAWHNPDLPAYDGGVEEAIDVLSDAGYRWDDGTLLAPADRFTE